jgi:hypothetical protein
VVRSEAYRCLISVPDSVNVLYEIVRGAERKWVLRSVKGMDN